MISYLRQEVPDLTYQEWFYVPTTRTVVAGIMMPVGGEVARRFGVRTSIIIGAAIYRCGVIFYSNTQMSQD